jgi:hypothetical protein
MVKSRPEQLLVSLVADTEVFTRSLYIQALAAMQSLPESELLSYYQIAGKCR